MNVFSRPDGFAQPGRGGRHAGDDHLFALSLLSPVEVCAGVGSARDGLTASEAENRLRQFGLNLVTRERRATILEELWGRAKNPLNALLLTLAVVSWFLGDARASVVIVAMVVLAITTAFIQEHRSNEAAAQLRAMVHTTASVRRNPHQPEEPFVEIPIEQLVPGDVVRLSAGDMIPADLRLLEAKDLFINQSALTGEAMPAEKYAHARRAGLRQPVRPAEPVLHGRKRRVSGYGTGVILRTGAGHVLRPARARDRRPARSDRLRPRHQPVHLADDPLHRGDGPGGVPDQRPHQARLAARRCCSRWRSRSA